VTLVDVVYAALLCYFVVLNLGYLILTLLAVGENRQRFHESRYTNYDALLKSRATLGVSVVIGAYNEERALATAIRSVIRSSHPEYELIVVNDGSTDDTLARVVDEFGFDVCDVAYPVVIPTQRVRNVYRSRNFDNLWLIDKCNGRQADALNAAVNLARYDYIAHTDADCVFERDTLIRTMRVVDHDPQHVVGVGGALGVSNGRRTPDGRINESGFPGTMVERVQVLEYMCAFLVHRLGWARLNFVPVVSGGYGIWRRDVIIELGGYATDVTHPDIEITVAAHEWFRRERLAYRVAYVPDAVVWTEVPGSWSDLRAQRKRWQRVVFEVIWKHRRMQLNPRYGAMGVAGTLYLLAYEGMGPFVEAAAYVLVGFFTIRGTLDLQSFLLFVVASFGLASLSRMVAVLFEVSTTNRRDVRTNAKLLGLAVIEPAITRLVLLPGRMYALVEFARGEKSHQSMTRSAVETPPRSALD